MINQLSFYLPIPNLRIPFEPKEVYHVYNHANGEDVLFRSAENYHYFLQRYAHYISPIADTYAYCLLPNHFHLMVRIKDEKKLVEGLGELSLRTPRELNPRGFENLEGFAPEDVSKKIVQQFGNWLNSYAKAYNKMYKRRGSLFVPNLHRKPIASEDYYSRLVYYIHANPVRHGFVKKIADWAHSSYHAFLQEKPTRLLKNEVLEWFGGKEVFIQFHQTMPSEDLFSHFDPQ